jgi:hypothetical protein
VRSRHFRPQDLVRNRIGFLLAGVPGFIDQQFRLRSGDGDVLKGMPSRRRPAPIRRTALCHG